MDLGIFNTLDDQCDVCNIDFNLYACYFCFLSSSLDI